MWLLYGWPCARREGGVLFMTEPCAAGQRAVWRIVLTFVLVSLTARLLLAWDRVHACDAQDPRRHACCACCAFYCMLGCHAHVMSAQRSPF